MPKIAFKAGILTEKELIEHNYTQIYHIYASMVYWLEHRPGVREVPGSKHPGAESYQRLIKWYKLLPS